MPCLSGYHCRLKVAIIFKNRAVFRHPGSILAMGSLTKTVGSLKEELRTRGSAFL